MRVIVFLLFGLMSLNAFADSTCLVRLDGELKANWTGECVGGYVHGVGLMRFINGKGFSKTSEKLLKARMAKNQLFIIIGS